MFIHVSWPLTDLRAFGGYDRTKRPSWPTPQVNKDFVRSFGVVRPRRLGGVNGFESEETYVDAPGLHFSLDRIRALFVDSPATAQVIFRRLYSSGGPVLHVDLGILIRRSTSEPSTVPVSKVLEAVLSSGMKTKSGENTVAFGGGAIALQLLRATTRHGHPIMNKAMEWTSPTLVVESDEDRDQPLSLLHLSGKDALCPAWLIGRTAFEDTQRRRALRLTLVRLRAEREALRSTLRAYADDELKFEAFTDAGDRLMSYLNRADRLVKGTVPDDVTIIPKEDYDGVLAAALQSERLFQPGTLETLQSAFQRMRPNILKKIELWADVERRRLVGPEEKVIVQAGASYVPTWTESLHIEGSPGAVINRADGSTIRTEVLPGGGERIAENIATKVVTTANNPLARETPMDNTTNEPKTGQSQSISDSPGAAQNMGDNNDIKTNVSVGNAAEIKQLTDELLKHANEAAAKVSKDDGEIIKNYAKQVADEAQKEEPNRKWYDVSAKGLKDAAAAVADIVPSIGETLLKLGKLVFGG